MSETLFLTASIDIQASAADKPATVEILAYNGDPIELGGWGTLVIELAGLQIPESIPLLTDHTNEINSIAGQGSAIVQAGVLTVSGTIARNTAAGQSVLALAKDGIRLQASLGAKSIASTFIAAGETVTANAKSIKAGPAGLRHITKSELVEVSLVAIGADRKTSVSIAAARNLSMTTNTTIEASDPIRLEKQRTTDIQAACVRLMRENQHIALEVENLALDAIQAGDDVDAYELAVVRAARPKTGGLSGRRTLGNQPKNREMLEASLLLRSGQEAVAIKAYGEQTVQAAHQARLTNLMDFCKATLQAEFRDVSAYHNDDEMIRAAFSTVSLPNMLSNVAGKSLVAAYEEATTGWRSFAYIASAANFKPQTGIRPAAIESLEEVGAAGEIKHGTLNEGATYPWQVGTFARMLGVTRRDIINDDLGFISEVAPMLGTAAGRALNDKLWQTILTNAGSFFSSGNGNLGEASSALAVGTLGAGVSAMRSQRDSQGHDLAIAPRVLVVGPSLELTARALLNSAEILGPVDEMTPNGNPVSGIVPTLHVEPRLANSERFTGTSATQWYLFAAPMARAVIVGFLRGRQQPTIEIDQAPFNTLGIQMRCVFDFGVALGDPKAAYKATGAGAG